MAGPGEKKIWNNCLFKKITWEAKEFYGTRPAAIFKNRLVQLKARMAQEKNSCIFWNLPKVFLKNSIIKSKEQNPRISDFYLKHFSDDY